ncbi:ATP-binding protein [Streptosporangium canum]|uniref:ATP-binding protein n=1 Tax=Streptosporangium canum TaxID=324952 RepID=UPI0036ACB130
MPRRGVPRWSGPARQVPSTRPAGCRDRFPELAEAATREQKSYPGFLAELLMAECDGRARRRSERRIKAAQFPRDKSLRAFDANPGVDPAVIHTLAACEWVTKGRPLCLIGDSDIGESRLLIALGAEVAMKGCGSNARRPPSWSTSSSKPPTTSGRPRPSPAMGGSTRSASMSSVPWNWIGEKPPPKAARADGA